MRKDKEGETKAASKERTSKRGEIEREKEGREKNNNAPRTLPFMLTLPQMSTPCGSVREEPAS